MIALDLFAALMAADLPNRDCIVLAELLVHSYGPKKARSVHLDPATIEHYTGLHRNNARRAIGELEKAGIIARLEDGSYTFVKDYESWQPGGKPLSDRLSGGVLRFAQSAVSRVGKRSEARTKSTNVAIQADSDEQASDAIQPDITSTPGPIQRDSLEAVHVNPTGLGFGGSCESSGIAPDADATGEGGNRKRAHAPASEDQRDLRLGDKEREERAHESSRAASIPIRPKYEPLDFGDGAITGPGADSPEAVALASWAEPLGNDNRGESYAYWARQQCNWTPPEWVRAILEGKVAGRTYRPSIATLSRIAADWRAARRPEWQINPAIPGGDPSSAPPRETPGERRTRQNREFGESEVLKARLRKFTEKHQ